MLARSSETFGWCTGLGKEAHALAAMLVYHMIQIGLCINIRPLMPDLESPLCLCNRSQKSRLERKKLRSQNEQMKALMGSLMTRKGEGGQQTMDRLMHAHELAFVMTDMEGSTTQASTDPAAFEKIQQVHDMVRQPPC